MSLVEVVRDGLASSRAFRRTSWGPYQTVWVDPEGDLVCGEHHGHVACSYAPTAEDVLATDWSTVPRTS